MAASSCTGQRALQSLPSKSLTGKRKVEEFTLPEVLLNDRTKLKSSKDEVGLAVLKVTKNGKLHPRRLAISRDRRNILVTSTKIRSFKGLLKAAAGRETTAVAVIPFLAVDRVQRGTNSNRFGKADELVKNNSLSEEDGESGDSLDRLLGEDRGVSLSIVYRSSSSIDDPNAVETLDLVVPKKKDYNVLVNSLESLVEMSREDRQRYTADIQLLHQIWSDMGKDWDATMTMSEWMSLTDKLHVPLKKSVLMVMFRDQCHEEHERLSLPEIGILLDQVRRAAVPSSKSALEKLWAEMVKSDPKPAVGLHKKSENDSDSQSLEMSVIENKQGGEDSVSAVAFLSFLRSQQKEYQTTLQEAVELIQILNQQQSVTDKHHGDITEKNSSDGSTVIVVEGAAAALDREDRLSRSKFMAYLQSDFNDLMRPDLGKVGADDMTQPLQNYWIHTSHDTYLKGLPDNFLPGAKSPYAKQKGGQHVTTDAQAYTAALLRGVRCLELDLWDNGDGNAAVVGRHQDAVDDGKCTPLATVLRTVRYFLEQNPYSFPVILRLENHCSASVQQKVARDVSDILGAADLIAGPPEGFELENEKAVLPSPESARGRVILMGKRPKQGTLVVVNDDFDAANGEWVPTTLTPEQLKQDHKYDETSLGVVTGFDRSGPIRSVDSKVTAARSPEDMLHDAEDDADEADRELEEAKTREAELHRQADEQETLAAQLTLQAGLTPGEVKVRAARAAGGKNSSSDDEEGDEVHRHGEEKSSKEEGVEVHEVLPDYVDEGRDLYARLAQEALEAAQRLDTCKAELARAEKEHQKAVNGLSASRRNEEKVAEMAKSAAIEARAQAEHAATAKERVEKVRELLRNSKDRSSSAGTVVQTALTEAKISEKRASDAEARAKRAQGVAEKDRLRAEEETRIEENMEQEVSDYHEECICAGEAVKSARLRVEKASTMLERTHEQIRLIEHSSQYREELVKQQDQVDDRLFSHQDFPFITKLKAKMEEADRCRDLIREATEESQAADAKRSKLQTLFEEKAHAWRIQAELASQTRRTADRSSNIAEELTEHAEEEREAALLRLTARQRAEAAVESRDSHRQSYEAQFAEAERAAAEAAKMAVQSRSRADRLANEAEMTKDHSAAEKLVEDKKWELKQATGELEAAQMEKDKKDSVKEFEKRRLDSAAELCKTAERTAASGTDKIKVVQVFEQEAIVAFNTALMLRKEANKASRRTEIKQSNAEAKSAIADYALEYRNFMDRAVELSPTLAQSTLLHTSLFKHWDVSSGLSSAHVHSFSQNALLEMVFENPEDERAQFLSWTQKHLCRVFPSWKGILEKRVMEKRVSVSNYDPVFAWSLGCQMVAMNLHSSDENALVADGLFRKNGSCGYVLKPKSLTHNDSKPTGEKVWTFRVLAGSNLLPRTGRRVMNPFVTIALYGGSEDALRSVYRTVPAHQNGLNPVWNETTTFTLTVENPDVAMVSFAVWNQVDEKTEEFVGGAAIPACCLREGYRSIPLFSPDNSRSGRQAFSSIVVKASTAR